MLLGIVEYEKSMLLLRIIEQGHLHKMLAVTKQEESMHLVKITEQGRLHMTQLGNTEWVESTSLFKINNANV